MAAWPVLAQRSVILVAAFGGTMSEDSRAISLVHLVIDRRGHYSLGDIASDLQRARIGGHDVLHILVDPKAEDIPIPHVGHSAMRCDAAAPCMDRDIIINHGHLRSTALTLVLDGAFPLADQDTVDFELRPGVCVMMWRVHVPQVPPNYARFDLVNPWPGGE
jgi:hypothetical protein